MNVELSPPQPPEVAEAVAEALALGEVPAEPDPWWSQGLQEQLAP